MAAIRKHPAEFLSSLAQTMTVRGHGPLPLPSRDTFPAPKLQGLERVGGFTLIELVVVVAIVAVLAVAATLSVNAVGGARVVEREARRFEALVSLACERAQVTGRDVGVHLGARSYAFSTFLPAGWRVESAGDLRTRELPRGFSLTARRDGIVLELVSELPDAPQLVCYASGELTPFALEIDAGAAVPRYAVRGAPDGVLEWQQQDDRS